MSSLYLNFQCYEPLSFSSMHGVTMCDKELIKLNLSRPDLTRNHMIKIAAPSSSKHLDSGYDPFLSGIVSGAQRSND